MQFADKKTLSVFSFHWSKEETSEEEMSDPIPTSELGNAVIIPSVSKEHFGQYKCEIKKKGEDRIHFTALRILLEQKPSEGKVTYSFSKYISTLYVH